MHFNTDFVQVVPMNYAQCLQLFPMHAFAQVQFISVEPLRGKFLQDLPTVSKETLCEVISVRTLILSSADRQQGHFVLSLVST